MSDVVCRLAAVAERDQRRGAGEEQHRRWYRPPPPKPCPHQAPPWPGRPGCAHCPCPAGDPCQHGHTPPARYRRPPLTPRLATLSNQEGEGDSGSTTSVTPTIARPRPATPVGNAPAAASKGENSASATTAAATMARRALPTGPAGGRCGCGPCRRACSPPRRADAQALDTSPRSVSGSPCLLPRRGSQAHRISPRSTTPGGARGGHPRIAPSAQVSRHDKPTPRCRSAP
jgi:hypothetical protein